MTQVAWSGADPTVVVDTTVYELGTEMIANGDITITHIRAWADATQLPRVGRTGRIWDTAGNLLATAAMPTTLTPGWTLHALDAPVARTTGQRWVASYNTSGGFGRQLQAFNLAAVVSADGLVTSRKSSDAVNGNGVFRDVTVGFPNQSANQTFYGIDIGYDAGVGGNTAPVVTNLALSASGLAVTATITATDAETLVGATYRIDWQDGSTSFSASASHTYASAGLKAILARVTDAGGLSGYLAGAISLTDPATGPLHPTTELVAVAWLKSAVPYLGNRVSTKLPQDNTSWSASGFTTVYASGGSPHLELAVSKPVVSVDTWGMATNSGEPQWNLAAQQAEEIKRACEAFNTPRWVTMPAAYKPARVMAVLARTEPRRIPGDAGNYAHFQQDLEIWWVE